MAMARDSVGVAARSTVPAEAKLALLEDLQRSTEPAAAAQSAAEWLLAHSGAERTIFAAPDHARGTLTGIAGAGIQPRHLKKLAVPLDDVEPSARQRAHQRLHHYLSQPARCARQRIRRRPVYMRQSRRHGRHACIRAVAHQPGHRDARGSHPMGRRGARTIIEHVGIPAADLGDEDPRVRREHALLFSIINAATDPILFTNMEGQLIIANARAEMLFTAPDDVSEGRRRAVQLNNMFFSAALSRTALGEGEAGRRELLLVDPTEGSDLLFELLSTVVSDPREGTGVVSILRNITDLRMATRQIDENYAKLRAAEAEVRAERDRLNLLIDSVADPDHRDGSGRRDLADEQSRRAPVHRGARAPVRMRSVSCAPTTRISRRSCPVSCRLAGKQHVAARLR